MSVETRRISGAVDSAQIWTSFVAARNATNCERKTATYVAYISRENDRPYMALVYPPCYYYKYGYLVSLYGNLWFFTFVLILTFLLVVIHHNRLDVRKQFFACRVVNIWKGLPAECTNFSSLNSFRHSLSSADFSKFLTIDWLLFIWYLCLEFA